MSTYHQVIYCSRQQLKNYQLIQESCYWPETVEVMDESFTLDGAYYNREEDEPNSMYGWVDRQFRTVYHTDLPMVHHCLRIWWGLYEQITQWLIENKRYGNVKWKEVQYLIYNTAWTLLGYADDNQDPTAIQLAAELMGSPSFQKYGGRERLPTFDGYIPEPKPPKPHPMEHLKKVSGKLPNTKLVPARPKLYAKEETSSENDDIPEGDSSIPLKPKRPSFTKRTL